MVKSVYGYTGITHQIPTSTKLPETPLAGEYSFRYALSHTALQSYQQKVLLGICNPIVLAEGRLSTDEEVVAGAFKLACLCYAGLLMGPYSRAVDLGQEGHCDANVVRSSQNHTVSRIYVSNIDARDELKADDNIQDWQPRSECCY